LRLFFYDTSLNPAAPLLFNLRTPHFNTASMGNMAMHSNLTTLLSSGTARCLPAFDIILTLVCGLFQSRIIKVVQFCFHNLSHAHYWMHRILIPTWTAILCAEQRIHSCIASWLLRNVFLYIQKYGGKD
jgi:hypothetical protein